MRDLESLKDLKKKFVESYSRRSLLVPDFRSLDVLVVVECSGLAGLRGLNCCMNIPSPSEPRTHLLKTDIDAVNSIKDARPP